MKAYLLYEAGGPDKLVLSEAQKPTLKGGEVLIKVKAIGINPADTIYRNSSTFINAIFGETRPVIMGWDISGEIVEKAENTSGFEIGDAVFALLQNARGYAEFVAVSVSLLARKPNNISFEEAAAATLAALTAWEAIVDILKIKKGDRFLVHAAAGGVGHFAVQIAKHFGAYVIGTSSSNNKDFVMRLGADEHADYRAQPLNEVISNVDKVLDTIGGDNIDLSLQLMKKGGSIVSIPSGKNDKIVEKAEAAGMHGYTMMVKSSGENQQQIARLIEANIVHPFVSKTFSFNNMKEAHLQIESGKTVGKVVVTTTLH